MTTKEAVDHIVKRLQDDSEYRYGWQANIAMAFKDAARVNPHVPEGGEEFGEWLHRIANVAAIGFLYQLAPTDKVVGEYPGMLSIDMLYKEPWTPTSAKDH